jgi:Zn-dependent M16 (insulinase) family peptidase
MLKRSLNTFMNAWTGELNWNTSHISCTETRFAAADHTSYPFSTQNEKDFENLMSVYLDATFHPLLQELDFRQEGFRYDFDDAFRYFDTLIFCLRSS